MTTEETPRAPSALAERIGSDEGMAWVKRGVMAVAVGFLVLAAGYFVGVRTTQVPANAVDIGFLQDMSDHHDQAVRMSQRVSREAADPIVRKMAGEIVIFQRYELGQMATLLQNHGAAPADYDEDRTTMAWMDMTTPLRTMPGMASDAEIAHLDELTGPALDKEWLRLMINHHRGGAHMSEYAETRAADPAVVALAKLMAKNQTIEVVEYQGVLDRIAAANP